MSSVTETEKALKTVALKQQLALVGALTNLEALVEELQKDIEECRALFPEPCEDGTIDYYPDKL